MPNVNGRTLVMAIQAVDFKIADLERTVDELPSDQGVELESLLLAYENATEVLRTAYAEARSEASNLPPYEKLVRADDSSSRA